MSSFNALAIVALVLGNVWFTAAQSISPSCLAAFSAAVTAPGSTCLNGPGLVTLFTLSSNISVVGPLDSWFSGFCAASPCTDETISSVIANVASGCPDLLAMFGLTSAAAIAELIAEVQDAYPLARQLACLKDETAHELCVVETLSSIESRAGALTYTNLQAIGSNVAYGAADPKILSGVACNLCYKASVDVLLEGIPSIFTPDINSTITNECGPSFLDGLLPATIGQSAIS